MIDICLLGSGGMMPLPYRYLTSLIVRYNGKCVLIDCGEGTQIAMKKKGISAKPIDMILFTHYHADHISGLPGLLLTMGNAERKEPLTLVGPKGLERVVNALRVIAPELPFEIKFIEITTPEETIELPGEKDFHIHCYRVNHNVTCYCYSMELSRAGKFDPVRAAELGIPKQMWGKLQKGEQITVDGQTFVPDMVMGPARKGLKLAYATDSRPCAGIEKAAQDADLFICEGMYGEDEKLPKAKEHKHMTFREAAQIAAKAKPKEMWLTHYSPALVRPDEFMPMVKEIFPQAYAGKDGKSRELKF